MAVISSSVQLDHKTASHPHAQAQLYRAVAIALLATAALLAGLLTLVMKADWWTGFLAATIISILSAGASVPVVALGLRHGPRRPEMVTGLYFASMFVRAALSLGGGILAVFAGDYPKNPTLLLIIPYYFSILVAETLIVARLLLPKTPDSANQSPAAGNAAENQHA